MECWNDGILECWNDGTMEWWNGGMLECWNGGMMERWNDGILEWWNDGMMEWWNIGLIKKDFAKVVMLGVVAGNCSETENDLGRRRIPQKAIGRVKRNLMKFNSCIIRKKKQIMRRYKIYC